MAQGSAQTASISLNRASAVAPGKMIVKKFGNYCLVDTRNAQTATV
ncbi:hypothetical protein PQQ59_37715 [Paraburkholderia aspalathi]